MRLGKSASAWESNQISIEFLSLISFGIPLLFLWGVLEHHGTLKGLKTMSDKLQVKLKAHLHHRPHRILPNNTILKELIVQIH